MSPQAAGGCRAGRGACRARGAASLRVGEVRPGPLTLQSPSRVHNRVPRVTQLREHSDRSRREEEIR